MSDNDIDPRWQTSTDRASPTGPVHVHVEGAGGFRSVSRTPAAIAGVLLVCAVGFLAFRGWDALPAQLNSTSSSSASSSQTGATIHLTTLGANPPTVTVKPGETIVFINDTKSPQILKSDNLQGADGKALYTPAIFENARYSFVVGEQPNGEKSFASIVDAAITGKVVVSTTGPSTSSARSSSRSSSGVKNGCAQPLGPTDGVNLPPGECEFAGSGGSDRNTSGATSSSRFGTNANSGGSGNATSGANGGAGTGANGNGTGNGGTNGNGDGTGNGTGNGDSSGNGTGTGNGSGGIGNANGGDNGDGNGNSIPTNPNTVGNGQGGSNTYGTIENPNSRTSNRPPSQAETGPGFALAVALILSVAAMCVVHRKQILG